MKAQSYSHADYPGPERRAHHRYSLNLEKTLSLGDEQVPIMDISWGGVQLLSKIPHSAGEVVEFSISGFMVPTRVLECAPLDTGSGSEASFSIRCQFVQPTTHPDIKTLMKIVRRNEGEST